MSLAIILQVVIVLALTSFLFWAEHRYAIIKKIGSITLAYATGILAGNVLPGIVNEEVFANLIEVSVALSIPAVLFSASLGNLINKSRIMLPAFGIAASGAIAGALISYLFMGNEQPESIQTTAMLAGVYIGGTPNLSAIGLSLNAPEPLFILLNAGDTLFSALYLLFLLSVGPTILGTFLNNEQGNNEQGNNYEAERPTIMAVILTLIIALFVIGISFLLSNSLLDGTSVALLFLFISVVSLLVASSSLQKYTTGSYYVGHWFLILFALSLGTQANMGAVLSDAAKILPLVGGVIVLTLSATFLLAYIFNIKRDITIIASVAAVFGPPFVATVAHKINRPDLVAAGISCGLIGYAMGNFVGLAIAYLLAI